MPATFADRVKSLVNPGESIPAAAKRLGFPLETFRDWHDGRRKPHLDTFHELAERTGKSPLWLYDGSGPEELTKFNKRLKRHEQVEITP